MRSKDIESMKLTAEIDTLPGISKFFREMRDIEKKEIESRNELSIYERYALTKKELNI